MGSHILGWGRGRYNIITPPKFLHVPMQFPAILLELLGRYNGVLLLPQEPCHGPIRQLGNIHLQNTRRTMAESLTISPCRAVGVGQTGWVPWGLGVGLGAPAPWDPMAMYGASQGLTLVVGRMGGWPMRLPCHQFLGPHVQVSVDDRFQRDGSQNGPGVKLRTQNRSGRTDPDVDRAPIWVPSARWACRAHDMCSPAAISASPPSR